jgi:hypothetical protein
MPCNDGRKNNGSKPGERRGGRQKGTPNKNKKELTDRVRRTVQEFTEMRRKADLEAGLSEEEAQPIETDYCAVSQLAMAGIDKRNPAALRRQANADAAQYLTPKLKSVEKVTDPEENESRRELAAALTELITGRQKPTAEEEEEIYDRGGH